ncbi:MAG: hypothetical protein H6930_14545 [Rhodoferax sp.]|nr:hypothetical protein [Rhodoferax sp.]
MALAVVINGGRFRACNLAFVAFAAVMPGTVRSVQARQLPVRTSTLPMAWGRARRWMYSDRVRAGDHQQGQRQRIGGKDAGAESVPAWRLLAFAPDKSDHSFVASSSRRRAPVVVQLCVVSGVRIVTVPHRAADGQALAGPGCFIGDQ